MRPAAAPAERGETRAPARGGSGARGWMLPALVALALVLRLLPALRPLRELDDLTIPDDAYLSLTLARNIAHGLGPLYGRELTNGFQPLFVWILAPVFALLPHGPDAPIRAALLLLVACDVITLVLLVRLVHRASRSTAAPLITGLLWALNPYAIQTSLNALETSMAVCLLAATLVAFCAVRRAGAAGARAAPALGLGLLAGVAALARFDLLILAPLLAASLARAWRGARVGAAAAARALLAYAAGVVLGLLPWLLESFVTTGTLVPVSGRAVRFICLSSVGHAPTLANLYGPMLLRAVETVARKNAVAIALIGALAVALLGRPGSATAVRERLREHSAALLFAALLIVAYAEVVFGPWHFGRYFFPIALVLALVAGALLDAHLALPRPAALRRWLVAAACVGAVVASVCQPPFLKLWTPAGPGTWGYRRIGEWARAHFPTGTVIGGSQTGALGYFADDLVVINLDGVVNRAAYEAALQKRLLDYVRRAGVRDLVWQDDIEYLTRESRDARPGEVELVEPIPGFTTWGAPWLHYRVADRPAPEDTVRRGDRRPPGRP